MAHPLPSDVRTELWSQLAPYRQRHPAVRWMSAETWHVTLLFLGAVPAEHVAEFGRVVDQVAARRPPFEVAVAGGGGRARGSEAVGWLRIREGAATIIDTADQLAAACPADVAAGAPPRRTPAAHLTVARRASRPALDDLAEERWGHLAASWRVDRLALLRSHLEPAGARYETLHEARMYAAEQ